MLYTSFCVCAMHVCPPFQPPSPMSQIDKHFSFFASQKLYAAPRMNVNADGGFRPNEPLQEDNGRILLILNWISFCLVSDATDQSIAAALASNTSTRNLEIILSTNKPPSQALQEYAMHFIAAINGLARDPQSSEHAVHDILALIARYAWKRVHRKATLVINAGNPFSEVKETTLEILTRLVALKPTETNVLTAFNGIVSLTPSLLSDDPNRRFETIKTIMAHSATILASPLLQPDPDPERSIDDYIFVGFFYRRLHRLHFYQYGIEALLNPQRKMLRAKWQFTPRWLPPIPPLVLRLPRSSIDHACDIVQAFGYNPTREEIIRLFPRFKNGELWHAGGTQTLYVHPEAQMADYLTKNDIPLVDYAIGCSKRACHACFQCVLDVRSREEKFAITMPTAKIQVDWMCPNIDDPSYTAGMDRFDNYVRSVEFQERYERALVHWGRK